MRLQSARALCASGRAGALARHRCGDFIPASQSHPHAVTRTTEDGGTDSLAEAHMSIFPGPDSRRGNRLRPFIWGAAACLPLLPAIAMQFDSGVDWSAGDFIAMGLMLAVACGLYELATCLSGSVMYRAGFGLAVVTGFLTVWVNLAVGMFGSEGNPLNLVFGGVLLVAASGALGARFRARGMARAMAATAVAQLLAAAVGLAAGITTGMDEPFGPPLALETLLTACFALPWLASALLFREADRRHGPSAISLRLRR